MGLSGEQAEELLSGFAEFIDWYKAVNTPRLVEAVEDALDDTSKRIAYQLTEPDRASRKIADATETLGHPAAASTIRAWQQEWVRLGLVRQISPQKRVRIFDLEALGIDIGADLSKIDEANHEDEG